ncbi:MAG: hypothetical protein AAGJ83_15760, partial [Planctomycetota bacterium]
MSRLTSQSTSGERAAVIGDEVTEDAYAAALEFLLKRIDYERRSHPAEPIGASQDVGGASDSGRVEPPFQLQRTRELFRRLGLEAYLFEEEDSRPPVPLIHIAGTKGKGSTATMVSSILTAAGFRVGMYTSPHLTDVEERFRINNLPCSRPELIRLVAQTRPVADAMSREQNSPSFFELTTAMAILYFQQSDCEIIVLEVG